MSSKIWLGKLTRREFRTRMDAGELKLAILPVAAVEQHLEHLAMEHDWRSARLIAGAVAEQLAPHALVAEGLMAGISEHHMVHRGTLSLQPGTFLAVVSDLVDSLVRAGFTNILVLNGHGGNIAACEAVWDQFLRKFQVNVHFFPYWNVLTKEDAIELLDSGARLPEDLPGHAQEFETAIALHLFPENVRQEVWKDQTDPKPSMATAEKGQAFYERIIARVTDYAWDMIDGKHTHAIPPYHP